jgi:starch synthase
MPSAFEPGGIV